MYNMLHEVNMVARHEELVYIKRQQENAAGGLIDPDKFPIQRLSADLITEFESIWETERGKKKIKEIEKYVGHSLVIKDS
jgi:hypothetical protein